MIDRYCPICEHEFETESWEPGECPNCGNEYWSEEDCLQDYSDCWETTEWEKYI